MTDPDAAPNVDKADVRDHRIPAAPESEPLLAFLPQFGKPKKCPYCGHELFEDDDTPDDTIPVSGKGMHRYEDAGGE